jgi:drug/metabolite transporter (DMT)-like permease
MVFWNPIFNRAAFGTPITWRTWAAGAVALAGVSLLFSHSIAAAWHDLLRGGSGHFLLGLGLALVATLASSAGNVVVIKVREQSQDLMLTMAWSMCWGALLVAAYCLLTGQSFLLPDQARYYAGLAYLALFGSVIAFFAYFTLIARIGSQKAVYIGVITPVISVLLSVRLEHYRPGPVEWLGMILCLASVAWAVREPAPAATGAPIGSPAAGANALPAHPVPESP